MALASESAAAEHRRALTAARHNAAQAAAQHKSAAASWNSTLDWHKAEVGTVPLDQAIWRHCLNARLLPVVCSSPTTRVAGTFHNRNPVLSPVHPIVGLELPPGAEKLCQRKLERVKGNRCILLRRK